MTALSAILSHGLIVAGAVMFGLAAVQDLAYRLVSNRVPLVIAGLGLVLRVLDGSAMAGLSAAMAVFVVAAACWRRGWLGGADVKLFGAGALLVPPGLVLPFVLCTCLAGGVLAITYWLAGRMMAAPAVLRPAGRLGRIIRVERRRVTRGGPLPYATAITAGACFVLAGG